jgi:parallel beta-helix repeat protein
MNMGWAGRLLAVLAVFGVLALPGAAWAKTFEVRPGPDAEQRLTAAFAEARPGDVIYIRAGQYDLTAGLRLSADRVQIRGEGPDRSILSFAQQGRPAPGLTILSDVVTLRDFAIADSKGDGVRAIGADGLEASNIRVSWSVPPAAEADGLSIRDAGNVQVSRSAFQGAPGAGLRLSGVRTAIVREVATSGNGVGVGVHNVRGVEVHSSRFIGNAIGVLVRDRPGTALGGSQGVMIFRNRIEANNAARPAMLDAAGGVMASTGVGVAVMAAKGVFIRENVIAEHATIGVLLMAEPESALDPGFIGLPQDVAVIANSFGRSGFAPAGGLPVFDGADIIWDGAEIFVAAGQVRSLPVRLSIQGNVGLNGLARFSNLNLAAAGADPADAAPDPTLPDAVALPEPPPLEIRR